MERDDRHAVPIRLFVYGTLKRGFSRACLLADQRFLGEALTAPVYRIYDCGEYPGLVQVSDGGRAVEGEVWEVVAARVGELDDVEEVGSGLYRRSPVQLEPPFDGQIVETYYYLGTVTGLRDCGTRWP